MRFKVDQDLHVHSFLSVCSRDEAQVPQAILDCAVERGLRQVCLTDHYWDERVPCNTRVNWWYEKQDHAHVCSALPLPKAQGVEFLFGCEADMDSDNVIGLSKERCDEFDFIIVATTHFHHMGGPKWENIDNAGRAAQWAARFEAVLDSHLPLHKVGIAHLACGLINNTSLEGYYETLELIPDAEMERLFTKAAKAGVGIELNIGDMRAAVADERVMRMFRIAKDCGCKFYTGTDSHSVAGNKADYTPYEKAIDILDLKETDKFRVKK